MKTLRPRRPSAALVISILALAMALVGTGYAAFKLPKKSVGTAQLKAAAVTNAKIRKGTITGRKLKLSTIGTVPSATHAAVADSASSLQAPEVHVVGAPGQPGFAEAAKNLANNPPVVPASFFKDHDGVVHLEGLVDTGTTPVLFVLPPGFRPPSGDTVPFATKELVVFGSGVTFEGQDRSGAVFCKAPDCELSGISFLAGS